MAPVMRVGLYALATAFLGTVPVWAEPDEAWLLGDWQGRRTAWAQQGLDFEFALTWEGLQNVSGGVARSSRGLVNLDLVADCAGPVLGLSEHGQLHAYVLANAGGRPSAMVGDVQTSSNIEAPEAVKLYEFWWRQALDPDRLAVLVGLHDYNALFDALETAGVFTNSSFGISPDISQVPPSIFPVTALAAVVSLTGPCGGYVHGAVYDGVPGDPGTDQGTQVILKRDDGLFYAVEAGWQDPNQARKVALGGWFRTTDFTADFSGVGYGDNWGVYLAAEPRWPMAGRRSCSWAMRTAPATPSGSTSGRGARTRDG